MSKEKNCPKCTDGQLFNGERFEQCDVCDGLGVIDRSYASANSSDYFDIYTNYGLLNRYKNSGRVRFDEQCSYDPPYEISQGEDSYNSR